MIGLAFKVCSTKQSVVPNTSSVTCLLPSISCSMFNSTDEALPIAAMMWCTEEIEISGYIFMRKDGWSHVLPVLETGKKFLFCKTKLAPPSDQKLLDEPQRAAKRSMHITHEMVSSDGTTSNSTALTMRLVKRKPHLFSVLLQIGT